MAKRTKRQQAILRRNLFLGGVSFALIAAIVGISLGISGCNDKGDVGGESSKPNSTPSQTQSSDNTTSDNSSDNNTSSEPENKNPIPSTPDPVQVGTFEGDANFSKTILVNFKNPLPADHDYKADLIVFPKEYKWYSQGEVYRKLNKDMWPYLKAMMDAARADGVEIGVISAWRDYGTQKALFDNKVNTLKKQGYSQADAEKKAATSIAIPGQSEHHTGLAVDFNTTQQSFENTKAYKWLKENAENYGFIMRYAKDKMDITGGIIYEPWHWRFVGINIAKEMNDLGFCYEEYCEYKGLEGYVY